MAQEINIRELIDSLYNIAHKISDAAHATVPSLDDIRSQISGLDSTISVEITCLTNAVEKLATEVRIAGKSDFITERRQAVEEIERLENLKNINQRDIKKFRLESTLTDPKEIETHRKELDLLYKIDLNYQEEIDRIIDLHTHGISFK